MPSLFDEPTLPGIWGDAEDMDTRMIADRMRRNQAYENSLFGRIGKWLGGQQEQLGETTPGNPVALALEGAQTANRWFGAPQFPERVQTGDALAPLGVAAMGAPFAVRGALGSAGGRLKDSANLRGMGETGKPRDPNAPPLGAQGEGVQSRLGSDVATDRVRLSTVEDLLSSMGVPFKKEASRSMSDSFGPSLSTYYRVETPEGMRTIRVSDHDYLAPDGGADIRLGSNVSAAKARILRLLGREVPPELAAAVDRDAAARVAHDKAVAESRRAEVLAAEDRRLEPFGAAHLTGKPRRDVLAAIARAEEHMGTLSEQNYVSALHALVRGMLRKHPAGGQ